MPATYPNFAELKGVKAVRVIGQWRHDVILFLGDHGIFGGSILRPDSIKKGKFLIGRRSDLSKAKSLVRC